MRDLGFAFMLMLMFPLAAISSYIGCLLWVWVAILSPNDSLTGMLVGVPLNKIVFGTVVLSMVISREKKVFYLDTVGVLLILFCISATGSYLNALGNPALADELYQKLLKEVALAFCLMWVMTGRNRLQMLALTIVIALSFIGVKEGLIGLLTAGGHKIEGLGSVGDNNALATALLMTTPFALYCGKYLVVRPIKLAFYGATALYVVTILLTQSRGGFGGLVILALLLIMRSEKKVFGLFGVACAAGLIFLLAPPELFSRLQTVENLEGDGSAVGRFVAWKVSLLIALAHPFFGGGGHAVQSFPVWNAFIPYIGSVDFITTRMLPNYAVAAHSIYFEMLGDTGFLGLGLFLSILGVTFNNCLKIRKIAKPYPELRWSRDLAVSALMSLTLYATTGALLSMGYFELMYTVVALVSACRRVVTLEAAELQSRDQQASRDAQPTRQRVPVAGPLPPRRAARPAAEIVRRI